jgi:hypothetical protein
MRIEDGTGQGLSAKVNEFGQLSTKSVISTLENFGATKGYTFNVNTGTISLTSANASALLYLKNNGESSVYVSSIGYLIGNSTGGSGDIDVEVLRNPTAGTIVSGATDVDIVANKNFGSSRPLTADVFKGAEGNTFTDGELAYRSLLNSAGKQYTIATGSVILPRGSSIGIRMTPQTGNTSMDVQVFLAVLDSNGFDS